jgi:HEXXH motif-containing protein
MLWGAILINANNRKDKVGMVQMLAHESAHNLLFGLCPDQPLVNNDPAERYSSPLRNDPRPIEGIYHATFVCARMHRAVRNIARSGSISRGQKAQVEKSMERNARAFASGMKTLDNHAVFTEPARAIIESARAYMTGEGIADC